MRRSATWGLIFAMVVIAGSVTACRSHAPVRIGVLLPLSGPQDRSQDDLLDWAAECLNASGGLGGRPVELVYRDSAKGDIKELAQQFVDDPSIRAVIGPETSAQVYQVAPMFIESKKLLVSPSSTSGDVFRAFGKKGFFWRTSQSDVAQVRTILQILDSRKVGKFALLAEDSPYGKTFSDWMGFFALERDMRLLSITKFQAGQNDLASAVGRALEGDPEYVVCAAFSPDAVRVKNELDRRGSRARLILTDAAETGYTLDRLGAGAEGLELVSPAADPESGFETAFKAQFGHLPPDFSASTFDAFYLAVCALARNEQQHGKQGLDESLADVVSGSGEKLGWSRAQEAATGILHGDRPDIVGASGPLAFDQEFGVDPLRTFYALNRVSTVGGVRDFRTVDTIDSNESLGYGALESGAAASRTLPSAELSGLEASGGATYVPGAKGDSWAVVIASSRGWKNYRHQADALAVYGTLKRNGFPDDRIILFLADDVPFSPHNPHRGDVHHVVGGENLRNRAAVDYSGDQVTVANLESVLLGEKSAATPAVLETGNRSNVTLFIVDHGAPGGIAFEEDATDPMLSKERFQSILETMRERSRFRQMLIVSEICHGESMADGLTTQGVLYLTGAGANEQSFGTNYEGDSDVWLADDFTYQLLEVLSRKPTITVADLYQTVYGRVAGSHVTMVNQQDFGDVYTTPMSDFLDPQD